MKIALIDLNHMTMGVHTNTVPLGIGLIAYYLKNRLGNKFDIRIFKDPLKFLKVKKWKPDILGITQYVWNSEMNLYMAQRVKTANPECLIVAGGPNLYLSSEERFAYLKKNNFIDVCVSFDGEIPFTEIVSRFIKGEKIEDIKRNPSAGTYSISEKQDMLIETKDPLPKLDSLNAFGAIYAEGFFNQFLNEGFHPYVQTQRGCPFKCTYCHTSNDYFSKVIFQSVDNFKKDMEYLGKRFAGQHNIILVMANTNFSLFKEDFEIARVIRGMQDKYDWPKIVNVNSGKNTGKLLELLSILKYNFTPAIALQTLTPKVLKNIKRINIPFEDFVKFQKKVIKGINESTATELILNLPEETKESFLDTVSRVLNSGVQDTVIYTLMALRGAPIASQETAKKYQYIIKHRIVQRCFSQINDTKIFEIEEVVVGTKNMPYEDYVNLRGLALIITVFANSIEMFPIRKFLTDHNLDVARWIFNIHDKVSCYPSFYAIYKSFLQETEDELFSSRNELVNFFNKQENYNLLCTGKLGDNLLRKYKTLVLSNHYKESIKIALDELRIMIKNYFTPKELDIFMLDLKLYLETRDVAHIFGEGETKDMSQNVSLHYDIPRWILSENDEFLLEEHKGVFPYLVVITDYIRNRIRNFSQIKKDRQFSLQILYRDGHIKDFWPLWIKNETSL
ncbi:MAG: radical SAM protein [Candidatus Omnitrophota bacterium]|nr:MAG: radical SAM protein [Candidatus Omnitrophota bacterium]